jgi:hypothetical protein
MGARGPKAGASLAVVAGSIDSRPQPPEDLTERQQKIWRAVVASEPADFFKTAALQILLAEFCKHTEAALVLGALINRFQEVWLCSQDGVDRYKDLLAMRERETKALADKATKLRLTNQSRYVPQKAGTATRNEGVQAKPWERYA